MVPFEFPDIRYLRPTLIKGQYNNLFAYLVMILLIEYLSEVIIA